MFTGLKKQLEISDGLFEDIVPRNHDLVKLKKVKGIRKERFLFTGSVKKKANFHCNRDK